MQIRYGRSKFPLNSYILCGEFLPMDSVVRANATKKVSNALFFPLR